MIYVEALLIILAHSVLIDLAVEYCILKVDLLKVLASEVCFIYTKTRFQETALMKKL